MASGKLDELKGRVIGIRAAKVSADDAQVALIEKYLGHNGSCGGPDRRCEAEAAGEDRPGCRKDQAEGGEGHRQGQRCDQLNDGLAAAAASLIAGAIS